MARLYDNDAHREEFMALVYDELSEDPTNDRANRIIDAYDAAPTIDTVRHARWEAVNEHCNHAAVFRCSGRDGCGASVDYGHYTRFCDYDWCPNCGARMDAEVLSKMETTTEEEKDG